MDADDWDHFTRNTNHKNLTRAFLDSLHNLIGNPHANANNPGVPTLAQLTAAMQMYRSLELCSCPNRGWDGPNIVDLPVAELIRRNPHPGDVRNKNPPETPEEYHDRQMFRQDLTVALDDQLVSCAAFAAKYSTDLKVLGCGTFGTTFLSTEIASGEEVVVKMQCLPMCGGHAGGNFLLSVPRGEYRGVYEIEALTMCLLAGTAVPRLRDIVIHGQALVLVMDPAGHRDEKTGAYLGIRNLLEGYFLSDQQLAKVFHSIYAAVEEIHSLGVAHGDLFSGWNIMVNSDLSMSVFDFGTATLGIEGDACQKHATWDLVDAPQGFLNTFHRGTWAAFYGASEAYLLFCQKMQAGHIVSARDVEESAIAESVDFGQGNFSVDDLEALTDY